MGGDAVGLGLEDAAKEVDGVVVAEDLHGFGPGGGGVRHDPGHQGQAGEPW